MPEFRPANLNLDREKGLTIEWEDGRASFYPIAYLRKHSPSADARELRKKIERNPLTVLPSGGGDVLKADDAELVGNYAIKITFNDGHKTGIYSWDYLRSIDPDAPKEVAE